MKVIRRLWAKISGWIDSAIDDAERHRCQKYGHDWVHAGSLYPPPSIWFECKRLGCPARTEAIPADVEWKGVRAFTLSAKGNQPILIQRYCDKPGDEMKTMRTPILLEGADDEVLDADLIAG